MLALVKVLPGSLFLQLHDVFGHASQLRVTATRPAWQCPHQPPPPLPSTQPLAWQAFEAAGYKWTPELCNADSDMDGFTNGQELGDPTCTMSCPHQPCGLQGCRATLSFPCWDNSALRLTEPQHLMRPAGVSMFVSVSWASRLTLSQSLAAAAVGAAAVLQRCPQWVKGQPKRVALSHPGLANSAPAQAG